MSNLSFQQSIETSQELIRRIEIKDIDETQARQEIGAVLEDVASGRGFFVSLLTGEWNFGNVIPNIVIDAIRDKPGCAPNLLAKNLVMSRATAITHERKEDAELAAGSRQVTERTQYIIEELGGEPIGEELRSLHQACEDWLEKRGSAEEGVIEYREFLDRWSYDEEQIRAMKVILHTVLTRLG